MSEIYLIHLAEWMNAQQINQSPRRRSKAAFLAVKDDVKTALDSEYSMHIVWKNMRDTERLSCSYKTFRSQVQRYIHQAVDEDDKDKGGDNADSEKSELSPPENKLQIENDEIAGG